MSKPVRERAPARFSFHRSSAARAGHPLDPRLSGVLSSHNPSMSKIETNKRRGVYTNVILCAALLSSSTLIEAPAFADDEDRPVIVVPRASGRDLFQNCVLCHKYDGRGGPSEGGFAADLRVTKLTRDELIQTITNGRVQKGMPPFKGVLDESKIETLATFIKEELKLKE
jgi:mono/diheme cytochrome c family protein